MMGKEFGLKLPTPDDLISIVVNIGKASFLAYDDKSLTLSIASGVTTAQDSGIYDIRVRWITSDLRVHEHVFVLCVTKTDDLKYIRKGFSIF